MSGSAQKFQESKKSSPDIVVWIFHVELGVGAEVVVVEVGADTVLLVLETVEVAVLPREVDPRVDERVEVDVEPDEAD